MRGWCARTGIGPEQNASKAELYLTSTYWAMTTLSTIGYGDISPSLKNTGEVGFVLFVQLVGIFVFSYVVSAMASLIANLNSTDVEVRTAYLYLALATIRM